MGIPQPEPMVTLKMEGRSLQRTLFELFKQTPFQYRVVADVAPTLCKIDVKKEPVTLALRRILDQEKAVEPLVFAFERNLIGGGVFVIYREIIEIGLVDGDKRVSLSNARLTKVLPVIFEKMGAKFRIEPDVPPVLVSAQLRPQDWAQALPGVILEGFKQEPTLTYSLDGDTYVVHLQKALPALLNTRDAALLRRVNVSLVDRPLRDALAEILKGSTWKYQVADKVPDTKVTYSASSELELSVLEAVLRQAAATGTQAVTYREGAGVLYIEPGPLPGEAAVVTKKDQAVGKRIGPLKLKRPIRELAQLLASTAGVTARVGATVPNIEVEYNSTETVSIGDAFRALVSAARASLPNLKLRPMGQDTFILELGSN